MKYALLAALCFCSTLSAAEPSRIVVSDAMPAIQLPAEIRNLSDADYEKFAHAFNAEQYDAAKKRYQQYLGGHTPTTATITKAAGSETSNTVNQYNPANATYSGGQFYTVGPGGRLGQIGYYGQNTASSPTVSGSSTRSTGRSQSQSYNITYPDLNDNGGGPVTILNPYFRTR